MKLIKKYLRAIALLGSFMSIECAHTAESYDSKNEEMKEVSDGSRCLRFQAVQQLVNKVKKDAKRKNEKGDQLKKIKNQFNVRVMTNNVCNHPVVQRNPELYKLFSWTVRKDRIFKQILEELPDLIGFQEIRNEYDEKSDTIVACVMEDLHAGLGKHGYGFVSFRNNPSKNSLINTIGYKVNKFALDRINRWWVSETPDRFSDDRGNGWGRVALMATFYPIVTKNIRGQHIPAPDYDAPPIHLVNVHHGMRHDERMQANQVLVEQINKHAHGGMVVITGDFNNFFDDGGAEELQVLADAGYQEGLNDLKTAEGVQVSGTFIGYSYDPFKQVKGRLAGQFDHVMLKSLSENLTFNTTSHVNLKKYNGNDNPHAKSEYELLVSPDGEDMRDEFVSDHAAGIVDVEVLIH